MWSNKPLIIIIRVIIIKIIITKKIITMIIDAASHGVRIGTDAAALMRRRACLGLFLMASL